LFLPDAQDSGALARATIFVKDDRLRPMWRIVLFAIVVACLTTIFWSVWDIAVGGLEREPPFLDETIAAEIAGAIAVVIAAYVLRRFVDRRSIASLGLSPRGPWLRLLLVGVCFGAGMQAFVFAIEMLWGGTKFVSLAPLAADARLLLPAIGVFTAGALLEELGFRGYLFQNFWEGFGLAPAIVVTSVLFACLHLGNPSALAAPAATFLGLVFFAVWACCSLLWTRSLWLVLGAHFAWNLFEGPVFGFPVSGLLMPMRTVVIQQTSGPAWLTGGAFGPEAGLSSLFAMTIGLVLLRWLYVRGLFANVPDERESYAR
jgi:uncharacterized protein